MERVCACQTYRSLRFVDGLSPAQRFGAAERAAADDFRFASYAESGAALESFVRESHFARHMATLGPGQTPFDYDQRRNVHRPDDALLRGVGAPVAKKAAHARAAHEAALKASAPPPPQPPHRLVRTSKTFSPEIAAAAEAHAAAEAAAAAAKKEEERLAIIGRKPETPTRPAAASLPSSLPALAVPRPATPPSPGLSNRLGGRFSGIIAPYNPAGLAPEEAFRQNSRLRAQGRNDRRATFILAQATAREAEKAVRY